jgi:hypothetical protein
VYDVCIQDSGEKVGQRNKVAGEQKIYDRNKEPFLHGKKPIITGKDDR